MADTINYSKSSIGVLETDDKLYYIIWNVEPFVIKEEAIKYAEKLNKKLEKVKWNISANIVVKAVIACLEKIVGIHTRRECVGVVD